MHPFNLICSISVAVDEGVHTGNVNRVSLFVALVWQLMKAYTLAMLTELAGTEGHRVVDKQIVEWVNTKVRICSFPRSGSTSRL